MPKKRKVGDRGGRKPKGEIPKELREMLMGIKVYRNKAHMSQEDLADAAGLSRVQLIRIEQGKAMPQLNELFLIEQEIRRRSPEAFKIIPLPAVDQITLQVSEVIRSDPERGKYLLFEIENHYRAALEAAKKEKPKPAKAATR